MINTTFTGIKPFRNVSAAAGSAKDLLRQSAFINSEPTRGPIAESRPAPATVLAGPSTLSSNMEMISGASTVVEPAKSVNSGNVTASTSGETQVPAQPHVAKSFSDLKKKITADSSGASCSTQQVAKPQATSATSFSDLKKKVAAESLGASCSSTNLGITTNKEITREPWQDQFETFVEILPDADPSYLEEQARQLLGKEEELKRFVADALEKKEYPSRKDWNWRQEQLALQKKYTEEFSIPHFLEIFPDPFTYFSDAKRQCDKNLGAMFLRNKFVLFSFSLLYLWFTSASKFSFHLQVSENEGS